MKYLDSNIFIYAATLPTSDSKAKKSKQILLDMADGKFQGATASLTWDELVWIVKRLSDKEIANKEGKKFLELVNLKILSIDEGVLHRAQNLIDGYKLDPRDAIHVAVAINNNITEFVSYDSDFDDLKEIKSKAP